MLTFDEKLTRNMWTHQNAASIFFKLLSLIFDRLNLLVQSLPFPVVLPSLFRKKSRKKLGEEISNMRREKKKRKGKKCDRRNQFYIAAAKQLLCSFFLVKNCHFIYIYIHTSIHLSVCLSIHLTFHSFARNCVYPSKLFVYSSISCCLMGKKTGLKKSIVLC